MKGIKITIPDYHDVFLDDLSYLQIGEQTDLVCLTGGHFKYYYKSFKVVPCSSISATKTFVGGIVPKVDAYYKDDFYSRADADSPRVSIRPILELSYDMFDAIISNSEVFNVEFEDHTYEAINLGTYPQYPASLPLQLALSLGERAS